MVSYQPCLLGWLMARSSPGLFGLGIQVHRGKRQGRVKECPFSFFAMSVLSLGLGSLAPYKWTPYKWTLSPKDHPLF